MGIRRKVLVTLLGVALPSLLSFIALIVLSTAQILRENATRQVSSLADRSAAALEEMVGRSRKTLVTMSSAPSVQAYLDAWGAGDRQAVRRSIAALEEDFLAWQKLDPSVQAIRLVDNAGNVLIKIKEGAVIRPAGPREGRFGLPVVHTVAGRDFFQAVRKVGLGEIVTSNLERGRVEDEEPLCPAMVRFATPLHISGDPAGALIINVWGQQAGQLINRLTTEEEGTAFLVERNRDNASRSGIYLFSRDESCLFGNQTGTNRTVYDDFPAEITGKWMNYDHGVSIDPRTGDILAHAYFSPYRSENRGWVVVVNARKDFFLRPLFSIGRLMSVWAIVVIIVTIAVSLFFARSLTRPIHAVVEAIRRMAGAPTTRIPERSDDEIGFLAAEINRMADAIQQGAEEKLRVEEKIRHTEKLAAVGELAAGLAHELNTPLGNIKALAILGRKGLAEGRSDAHGLAEDLTDIAAQAGKCSDIIAGLLGFARGSGTRPCRCSIREILLDALSLVRMRADKKEVRLDLEEPGTHEPHLLVDADLLRQVFVNVLLNAIDAAPGGGVRISLREDASALRVSIRDDGCGIAPEHICRIFDPFFTTKEIGEGTGLGLSTSYGIIRSMGGDITVDSAPGAGAEFVISLPLTSGTEREESAP